MADDRSDPRGVDVGLFLSFDGRRFCSVDFAILRATCCVFFTDFCFRRRLAEGAVADSASCSNPSMPCSLICSDAVGRTDSGSGADASSSGPHWNSSCPVKALRRSPVCSSTFSYSCLFIDSKITATVCVQHVRSWQQILGPNLLFGYHNGRGVAYFGDHSIRESVDSHRVPTCRPISFEDSPDGIAVGRTGQTVLILSLLHGCFIAVRKPGCGGLATDRCLVQSGPFQNRGRAVKSFSNPLHCPNCFVPCNAPDTRRSTSHSNRGQTQSEDDAGVFAISLRFQGNADPSMRPRLCPAY